MGDSLIGRTPDSGSGSWGSNPCPPALNSAPRSLPGNVAHYLRALGKHRSPLSLCFATRCGRAGTVAEGEAGVATGVGLGLSCGRFYCTRLLRMAACTRTNGTPSRVPRHSKKTCRPLPSYFTADSGAVMAMHVPAPGWEWIPIFPPNRYRRCRTLASPCPVGKPSPS
jgi:hypothetical protein